MWLRDWSIRKKLMFSNMMMILIPVVLILIITLGTALVLIGMIGNENQAALLLGTGKTVTNYQLQLVFDSMCEKVAGEDQVEDGYDLDKLIKSLEDIDAKVMIEGGSEAYITPGITPEGYKQTAESIAGEKVSSPVFLRNGKGLVYSMQIKDKAGAIVSISVISEKLTLGEDTYTMWVIWDQIKLVIKIVAVTAAAAAIIIVVVTGGILSGRINRTIMTPLNTLRKGANAIKDGDLDTKMTVRRQDELGQVCEDFEEMRLRLKESLSVEQQYDQSRKELIAGISHDLSTPLTSIKGYTSGILEGIANTEEKKQHYLKTIYNTACDMESLVDSLFLFSKLDLGKMTFNYETIDMSTFLKNFIEDVQASLLQQNGEIILKNSLTEKTMVSVDPVQLGRVLFNFYENSMKYTNQTICKMTVAVKSIENHRIEIRFWDNGPGVTVEESKKIFDTFYRTDPARSNVSKGSGLGLAICKEIVEEMQGSICAELKENDGLCMVVELPKQIETEQGK